MQSNVSIEYHSTTGAKHVTKWLDMLPRALLYDVVCLPLKPTSSLPSADSAHMIQIRGDKRAGVLKDDGISTGMPP